MQTEEQKLKQKCKDLKRKIREIEDSSEIVTIAVSRAKLAVRRLRSEYTLLLEVLEQKTVVAEEDQTEADGLNGPDIDDFSGLNHLLASTPSKTKQSAPVSAKKKRGGVGALRKAREKDPSIPKRPTNAYLIFCDLEKENVKKDLDSNNPGVVMDLSKGLTEAWKKLDEEARKPYYKLYEEDRLRYHRELEAYQKKKSASADSQLATSEPPSTPVTEPVEPNEPVEPIENKASAEAAESSKAAEAIEPADQTEIVPAASELKTEQQEEPKSDVQMSEASTEVAEPKVEPKVESEDTKAED
ncbi:unnamed protein product [Kuraishia capsulata CBS 1993]|uniref:HMG box domain-containing protein n=1 Tax=Kuraishia capsulata CBS 1993 TaxID=1382522 RepID=W6MRU3_9ASCO|nr:uncharacterized protein KUCA_T00005075001 [Kuraishia capsulata CBS 1993]CDK29088.1 unnamed protein product [Kuraishia capsulata CBS 1993]